MKKKITQINGKEETFKPSTLDQIWGDTGVSKYNTLDLAKYKESLEEMNLSDLQSHAIKIGVWSADGRDVLTRKLLKEFSYFVGAYRQPRQAPSIPKTPSANTLKILAEGR